ncbi:MAG: hypothetical protein ABI175_20545 [Polyangiales bacterium]
MTVAGSSGHAPLDRGWSFGEATLVRAAGFTHLAVMAVGLLAPAQLFTPWGIPIGEPSTFLRFAVVAQGALGLSLLRAVRLPRREGRLLVETCGLVMLAFFAVLLADTMAQRLPGRAPILGVVDLLFGAALFRVARR